MRIVCNPMNLEYRYQFFFDPKDPEKKAKLNRESADPTMIPFKGKYYLFPSMACGFWVTEDLVHYEFHENPAKLPSYGYAPDVRVMGDYMYFSASDREHACSFFRSKDPVNEPFEELPGTVPFWDPNLFIDDDGRVYLYNGCSNVDPLYGVELDPVTMHPLTDFIPLVSTDVTTRGFERQGDDHYPEISDDPVLTLGPWMEGSYMNKFNGKYYFQYAITGTQYNVYADAVFEADHPLGPFTLAKNNPFSYKPGGFVNGAGHGSTFEDADGKIWHIASMRISMNHMFERRLGFFPCGIDGDGELYSDQRYADWPMDLDAPLFSKPKWMLLSYGKPVTVSSGTGGANIADEDIRTWWKAGSAKPGEWAEIDLGKVDKVHAVQINFADEGIIREVPKDASEFGEGNTRYIDTVKQATGWLLEASVDGETYFTVEDKRNASTDYAHDLVVSEAGFEARFIRLTVEKVPYGTEPCVSGLRVFGDSEGEAPEKATAAFEKVDEMDLLVSWQRSEADGVNILFGHAEDKLYHSYMVFGRTEQHIRTRVKGELLYVRVDSFNEHGITEGDVVKIY